MKITKNKEGFLFETENYQILVIGGEIKITPVKGKEFFSNAMPPIEFWNALLAFVKERNAVTRGLLSSISNLTAKIADLKNQLEEKPKVITVGASKKEMFAAGVAFGKRTKDCTS